MPNPNVVPKVLLADAAANRFVDQLLAVLNPILRNVEGDLRGPVAAPTVIGWRGLPLDESMAAPAFNDVPKWNGSAWVPGTAGTAGAVIAVTASGPLSSSGGTTPDISLTGTVPIANGGTNSTATPTAGAVAYGTGTAFAWSTAGTAGLPLISGGLGAPSFGALALGTAGTVSGLLPIANGGTNSSSAPTAGAMAYGTGTAFAWTAAGTSGQVMTSAGSGVPTWQTPTATSTGAGIGGYRATSSSPASVALTDYVVDVTSASVSFTVNLPTAGSGAGQAPTDRVFVVKNSGGATVTVSPAGAQTIDGATSFVIVTQYAAFTFISTGSGWALL